VQPILELPGFWGYRAAMKAFMVLACGVAALSSAMTSAQVQLQPAGRLGDFTWSGVFTAGVCTVETASTALGPWAPRTNYFTSNTVGAARVPLSPSNTFCRILAVDISTNTPRHYTNLLESYGILETVAGKGDSNVDVSQWLPSFEGAWATNVNLSRPHSSAGDPFGNVLIVDQRSSSVLKVTPEGRLYTYAGTHTAGANGDTGWATNLHLNNPNGGWMAGDGTFYILDTENGKVRKVDTNGWMTTLFTTVPMGDGRAFWVKSDESLVYFGSGDPVANTLNRWTATGGVTVVRSDFGNLGNILGDERTGDLYISDRDLNRVFRMDMNGTLTTIAGNGTATGSGGEGFYATNSSLNLPRSVWFIPNGGFFIGEHDPGNRIWYVDPAGILHRWMNGGSSSSIRRVGDGQWFYANPSLAKVSRVRTVNTDPFGNIIITESNYGYVRRIRFQRMNP
jgi:hypothetical protein